MFGKIALFELRYQFRNPVFWVVTTVFFLLTFGAATSESIRIGSGGNVNANSPAALAETTIILAIFFMFVTTAFVANVIVRDDDSGFGPMVRSTRVSKFDYLIGRFTGAFAISAIAFLTVPFAIWLGSYMPWVDPETIGPNRLGHYMYAYFLLALPSIFLTSCLFFTIATITRSMMYSYVGVVLFLLLYLAFSAATEFNPDLLLFSAYAEPFGGAAYEYVTRYWTAAESNSMMAPFGGVLAINRLIWLAVSLAALAFAYSRFSFAERGSSKRKLARQQKAAALLAKEKPAMVETMPAANPDASAWSRLVTRTRFEMSQVFKSPAFFIIMFIGLIFSVVALIFNTVPYGTPAYPRTFYVIGMLENGFTLFPMIIAIFYGGELVWRDRDRKMHEIVDSTSLPNWAYMVPKTIAVIGVLLAALLLSMVAGLLVQLGKGYTDFELGKYLQWYLLPGTIEMVTLGILSVFVQALSPNKYIGWGIMVLYMVATITFNIIGWNHPLYLFGKSIPVPLSDMNGDLVGGAGAWWLRLYWGAFAAILALLAHLVWRRGTETSLMPRIKQLPRRLLSPAGAMLGVFAAVAVASGAYIYNNINVLNEYRAPDDAEKQMAAYEKKYLKYETLKQPSFTDFKLNIDIYPEDKRMNIAGSATIMNDTGAPVEMLHIRFQDPIIEVESVTVPGAKLEMDDKEFKYQIYRLNTPMAVGEKRTIAFKSFRHARGFRARENDVRLVENGTFLNNREFAPQLGMNRNGLLSDRATRRKYGLPSELRLPKLEDESAREQNYVGNVDWVMSDITVSTSKDQTPIAPGSKVSDEVKGDRRIARFVSRNPILAFFSVQSAQYAVKKRTVDGVDMAVYYHPSHSYNVKTMLDATATSLAYYKKNFGPYQFDYARIIEFPGYAMFAQAFAGTVPYSERIGFLANISDPDEIDYVTYVTAHEFGHQYWAHQLISANQQGGTMLVETMAQYSALMVMKQLYGEDKIRRFLKYELDRYLDGRGSEAIEELPLNRVEDQGYIHYRKGAVVMYLLQDRLGEDRVNAMLAKLLDRYRFKSQPYASSTDLVDGFKSLARDDAERQLVSDLLEKITIYDMKVEEARTRKLKDGRFETTITVQAKKFYADGEGKEKVAPLADNIEIGLFTAKPGLGSFGKEDVISMQRKAVKSGQQVIKLISAKKPEFAGIDPYNKYIDRNSDDNVIAVDGP
ncbi:putative membrane protein [hydrothermal vent metagenome]|uniref:Putative membrane protein n=1 Tax=hydrothermal vent metagenome TaxID=652676 RepID=A0A3B0RTU4_9ZZZZ